MSDKWLITSNGQLLFFCLLCVSILLVSCERRDLTYYEVSEITLTADWNDSGLDDKSKNTVPQPCSIRGMAANRKSS